MKYCPLCAKNYEDDAGVCEVDGATLKISGKVDPYLGKLIRGRYQVHKKLGEGGMGTVYLAEQMSVGRKVALKLLQGSYATDEEFIGRFRREARLAASLSHPNIVTLYDFDQADDGSLFIAMEYLPGQKLSDVIRRDGPLEIRRASRLALQIAEGLGAAHRAGVIHRDIKPDNIMVVGQNGLEEIKLMDFGIARLRDGASTTQLTRSGLIMGTPAYMAPEQAEGTEVSEKTDIYALGIVLYEMLSGTVPFKASTPAAVLVKQIQEAPVPLRKLRRDLPAALERTIMQALEKQPDRRQRNADEVADQLNKLSEKLRTDGATKGWTPTRTWNPFKKTPQESAESPDHKSWQIGKTVVHNEPALPTQVVAQPYAATQVLDRDETVTVSIPRPSWAVVKWGMVSLAALAFAGLIALGAYRYVSTGAPEIEKLAITSDKTNLSPRERITLAVNGTYSDKSVQPLSSGLDWHSSNDSVARVNDKGEVEGQQEGVVVITARYGGRISSSIDLVVKAIKPPPPAAPTLTALTIAAPKHELNPNERTVVQLSGRYSDGTDKAISKGVTWTISDHSVATVDATGRVTGRKSGAVNLSAEFNGISSAPITLTVKASVPEPAKSQAPKPATASATAEPKPSKPLGLSDETLRNSVELANVHYNNGDYQKAISILDGVLKTNPDYGLARSLRNKAQKACIAEGTCVK
jgi:serine/threonine-protein kinase